MSTCAIVDKFDIETTRAIDLKKINKNAVYKLWKSNGNNEIQTINRRKIKSANVNDIVCTDGFVPVVLKIFQSIDQ